jgi:enoyl-CoA hydratase/carnithine racemase
MTTACEHGVTVAVRGTTAVITVGTGARRNAMSIADWRRLEAMVGTLEPTVRAVVVRGYGDMFCSGSDMREWQHASAEQVDASFAQMEAALQAVEAIPVPTVAVVAGAATGAGCQLALACDVQLVARSARVGMPVAQLGILLSAAFATRLSVRVGPARAKELLYSGRLLHAEDAAAMGLISRAVQDTELETELESLLATWRAQPVSALRAAKAAVNTGVAPVVEAARQAPGSPSSDPDELPRRVQTFLHRNGSGAQAIQGKS